MKRIKRVKLLSMILMSFLSVMSVTSLANEVVREPAHERSEKAKACEKLLADCVKVVKKQKEAIHAASKEREVREAIIEGQDKQIKELKAERKVAVTTSSVSLGVLLLILLL